MDSREDPPAHQAGDAEEFVELMWQLKQQSGLIYRQFEGTGIRTVHHPGKLPSQSGGGPA